MAYIERETALKIIDNYSKTVNADGKVIVEAVRDIVDTICPVADVVEVRHGKWIKTYSDNKLDGNYYCSNCKNGIDIATGEETPIDRELYYCPNCGAKMDGKDGE